MAVGTIQESSNFCSGNGWGISSSFQQSCDLQPSQQSSHLHWLCHAQQLYLLWVFLTIAQVLVQHCLAVAFTCAESKERLSVLYLLSGNLSQSVYSLPNPSIFAHVLVALSDFPVNPLPAFFFFPKSRDPSSFSHSPDQSYSNDFDHPC